MFRDKTWDIRAIVEQDAFIRCFREIPSMCFILREAAMNEKKGKENKDELFTHEK
jgi:hypothetical protein